MTYVLQLLPTHKQILQTKLFSQIKDITSMIDALTILIQIKLNLEYQITGRRRSVLYALKKDVGHLSILRRSVTSQEIDSKSDLVNDLMEKLLSILPILKGRSSAQTTI